MFLLNECSLDQLLSMAANLHLLSHHRTLDRFVHLSTGTRNYVFDHRLARNFVLWLVSGHLQQTGSA